jgi:sporulation protein YlmC with PRC-barrel domain
MASLNNVSDTSGALIGAAQVSGTTVYDLQGTKVGSVEDVLIDKASGKIDFAVLSFGGFLGMGSKHFPLPWNRMRYSHDMGGYVVDVDTHRLQGAPAYEHDNWTEWHDDAWTARVNDFYR